MEIISLKSTRYAEEGCRVWSSSPSVSRWVEILFERLFHEKKVLPDWSKLAFSRSLLIPRGLIVLINVVWMNVVEPNVGCHRLFSLLEFLGVKAPTFSLLSHWLHLFGEVGLWLCLLCERLDFCQISTLRCERIVAYIAGYSMVPAHLQREVLCDIIILSPLK